MLSALKGRCKRALGAGAVAAAFGLFLGASPALAQDGAVAGQVVDSQSLEPIAGAQVFVQGTQLGELTNQEGRYRITGVPTGQQTVRVQLIGYKTASQTVSVSAGEVATADFQLEQTALKLQEVVVTGVAGETPQVKLPFSVSSVNAEDIPVPSASAGSLIQGKVAGAQIVQGSGQPGEDASIMLRGATSINASGRSQAPLIVIDGVIMGRNASLANINALDIKNIEVIKGAAAASLYGSRAQNGVIQITTKRGSEMEQNRFDLTVRGEGGIGELGNQIELARFHHLRVNPNITQAQREQGLLYLDADGNPTDFEGAAADVEPGMGPRATWTQFQDNPYPEEQLFDQVERFFDPGETTSLYAAGSGRFGDTNFRVSGETYSQQGILPFKKGYDRKNIRVNLDNKPGEDWDLSVSGFFSSSTQEEEDGDAFFSLTFMSPNVDLVEMMNQECPDDEPDCQVDVPRSQEDNPLYTLKKEEQGDSRQRIMGSGSLTWSPTQWLEMEGTFSYDRTDLDQREFFPSDFQTTGSSSLEQGNLWLDSNINETINAYFRATVTETFMDGDLTTRTKAQVIAEEQSTESVTASGNDFAVQGVPVLSNIAGTRNINSGLTEIRSMGYYLITALDYKGKYIVDGLVRRDGSSLFGENERWHNYFRVSGAYRLSQEQWWPLANSVPEFKVRASYGTAGARPRFSAQYETYAVSAGSVSPQRLGNNNLKPELAKEQEYGINAVFFDQVSLDVTYAISNVEDQILQVPLPGYFGFSSQWRNAGELRSETWEVALNSSIIEQADMSWSVQLNWSTTESQITELDVPPYQWGPKNAFFNREGEILGTFYGDRWASSCSELPSDVQGSCDQFQVNDEGHLVWVGQGNSFRDGFEKGLWGTGGTVAGNSYVWGAPIKSQVDGETFLPMGSTTPEYNASISSNFTWKGLQLYGLLDASIGQETYNQTVQWAYRETRMGTNDEFGKPNGLKKPVSYWRTLYNVNAVNSWFVEDGSYIKLRELSLSYSLNQSLLQSLFGNTVERVQFNVIGRDLFTWTDYTGYDPEVGFGGGTGGAAAITRVDSYQYPNFREISGAVQIVF